MRWVYLLALIPIAGFLGGAVFANRVHPYVLGMPFVIFWPVLCVALTCGVVAVIYRFDPSNHDDAD
ncbi:MAG: DUF3311 domain-containing protein [Rhodanobacteraceae bacterium]